MQSPNPLFYGSSSGIRKSPSAIGKGADGPHVSSLNILGSPTHTGPAVVSSEEQLNVRGWLMNVPGYRQDGKGRDGKEDHDIMSRDNGLRDHDTLHLRRARSASINSISSNESVNLDELIKNNFTAQVDDETDLPNLADLDLDDSADDFWKLDNTASIVRPSLLQETWKNPLSIDHSHEHLSIDNSFDENEFLHLSAKDELINWTPEDEFIVAGITAKKRIPSALPAAIPSRYPLRARDRRSGSMSSENSLTSQSTITTGVHHYGMTPMIYPSESTTSNSSRSPSRLSDYSAASSQASTNTSGIPRRRPSSGTGSSGLPTPNGSLNTVRRTAGNKGSNEALRSSPRIGSHAITAGQSRLAKRATHVPLPTTRTPPTTLTTTTSRSTGHSSTSRAATADKKGAAETLTTAGASGSRPGSRLGGIRSSHIPAPRKAAASPESPPSRIHARSPTLDPTRHRPQSPLGARRRSSIRSPTPTLGGGNAANSAFGLTSATKSILSQEESRIGRPITKPSGLKPPAAVGGMSHSSSQK